MIAVVLKELFWRYASLYTLEDESTWSDNVLLEDDE